MSLRDCFKKRCYEYGNMGDLCAACNEHYLFIYDHINVQMKETKKISFCIPRADDPDIIWFLRIHIGYRWKYYASLNMIIFLNSFFFLKKHKIPSILSIPSWLKTAWYYSIERTNSDKRTIGRLYDAGCPFSFAISYVMITNRKDQQINRYRNRRRRKSYYESYKSVIEHYLSENTLRSISSQTFFLLLWKNCIWELCDVI